MSDSPDPVRIAGPAFSATISPKGAELQTLRDAEGRDLQWDGDPAFWTGRAPILFPVIGCVAGGVIRLDGKTYPMAKHGFARHSRFALAEATPTAATLRLEDDAATRTSYPFAFRLDIRFDVAGEGLEVTATLHNPGETPLPASFGFHPALRLPLPGGAAAADHLIRFEQAEPEPIRRIDGAGLLRPAPEPTPVEGDRLRIRDALFEDDALIFDRPGSRRVTYGAPGGPALEIAFPGMPLLGVWKKLGAGFLCIEPWAGIADPEGFTGDFRDKPGVEQVAPGSTRIFSLRIGPAACAL